MSIKYKRINFRTHVYHQCPSCLYVSDLPQLMNTATPCPKCGNVDECRMQYPSVACYQLLRMISYFHDAAKVRMDNLSGRLVQDIETITSQRHTFAKLKPLIAESRSALVSEMDASAVILERIKKEFNISLDDQVLDVLYKLAFFTEVFEEHKVIVLLSCNLLELLLVDILVTLYKKNGLCPGLAVATIDKFRTMNMKMQLFEEMTGSKLSSVINSIDDKFEKYWRNLREERNSFTHKNPFAIDNVVLVNKALYLVDKATMVFSRIHNTFCLQQ